MVWVGRRPADGSGEWLKPTAVERHARGFTSRGQFVAMLFCQVERAFAV